MTGGWVDWVARMQAFLGRHPAAAWVVADDLEAEHVVTLGERELGRSASLQALVLELEELDRAGRIEPRCSTCQDRGLLPGTDRPVPCLCQGGQRIIR